MKKPNIKDVANKANVSVATVSRALNKPQSVKEKNRQKVMDAVEELEYDPDPVARALRNNKVKSIAVVVPNITNAIMAEMTEGAHAELAEQNYNTVLFNTSESFEREVYYCDLLKETMVEGAIFITGSGETPPVQKLAQKKAVCLINRHTDCDSVDQIVADEYGGMQLLVYHLYKLGHERIAFITGKEETSATKKKIAGYKEYLEELGLGFNKKFVVSGEWTLKGANLAMKELLQLRQSPSAVIVGTDYMGLGVISAINEAGLSIPDDIAITGFDNASSSEYYNPPLTTLNYPNYELGKMAARAVLNRIEEPDVEKKEISMPLEIKIRKSWIQA